MKLEPLDMETHSSAPLSRSREYKGYVIKSDDAGAVVLSMGEEVYTAFDETDATLWIDSVSDEDGPVEKEAPADDFDGDFADERVVGSVRVALGNGDLRMTLSLGQGLAICRAINGAEEHTVVPFIPELFNAFRDLLNKEFKGIEFTASKDGLNCAVPDFDELSLEPHDG